MPAIATDHEIGAYRQFALRRLRPHAGHDAIARNEIGRFRFHVQMKARIALRVRGEEIQEIPLRHQRDELAAGWHMIEVDHLEALAADLERETRDLLMRQRQELI